MAENAPGKSNPGKPGIDLKKLRCEFSCPLRCNTEFLPDAVDDWIAHHLEHLGGEPPSTVMCWFCDHCSFSSRDTSREELEQNYRARMVHVYEKHINNRPTGFADQDFARLCWKSLERLHMLGHFPREKWEELKEEYSELPKEYRLPEETESSGAGIGESVESGRAVHVTALEDRRRRREARKGKNIPERS